MSSEGEQLEEVVARIQQRVQSRLSFADKQVHSCAATLALIRIMIAHAHGLIAVSGHAFAETGSAHVRAMFEAWIDIYAILEPGREEENARRCIIFGLIEFRDHSIANSALSRAELQQIEDALNPYRQEYGGLVADVERQRTKRDQRNSFYWTGVSRGKLIKRMEGAGIGDTLRSIYKLLSWDAHHVIAVALQTSIGTDEVGEVQVRFHPLQLPGDSAAFNRELACKMLVKAWLQVSKHLQVEPG